MATERRMRFVRGQVTWMIATIFGLSALGALSYELFFTVSLVGFLAITELTAPARARPQWRRRLRRIVAIGLLVFGFVVGRRILLTAPIDLPV